MLSGELIRIILEQLEVIILAFSFVHILFIIRKWNKNQLEIQGFLGKKNTDTLFSKEPKAHFKYSERKTETIQNAGRGF